MKIIRNIKNVDDWLRQFKTDAPCFELVTNSNILETGNKHVLKMHNELWYSNWTTCRRGTAFDIRHIKDITKLLNNEYTYWEFVNDSYDFGFYYRIESSQYFKNTLNDKDLISWFKVPTQEIPRNFLPAIDYNVVRNIFKVGKYDLTDEEDSQLIDYYLNNNPLVNAQKWQVTDKLDSSEVRNIKLITLQNELL